MDTRPPFDPTSRTTRQRRDVLLVTPFGEVHAERRRVMCGRVTDAITRVDFERFFAALKPDLPDRYNIAPTRPLAIVTGVDQERDARVARWGLVPRDMPLEEAKRRSLFNARAETIESKPAFREAFARQRCLVPVSGLYEWHEKRPHFVRRRDGKPLVLAGLWDVADTDDGPLVSCTILTCPPNGEMAKLHDRMPVVLLQRDWNAWLNADTPPADLRALLTPYPDGVLEVHEVSPDVGNVRREGAYLTEPLAAE